MEFIRKAVVWQLNSSKISAGLEKTDCKLHHVYRALEILAKEINFFQSQLYKNSEMVLNRHKRVLYYDCTNYYFEIEEADDFRKYGHSKENRPNPIVQMQDYHQLQTVSSTTLRTGNLLQRKQLERITRLYLKEK
mgnify:CR=1 FL=1